MFKLFGGKGLTGRVHGDDEEVGLACGVKLWCKDEEVKLGGVGDVGWEGVLDSGNVVKKGWVEDEVGLGVSMLVRLAGCVGEEMRLI